MQTKDISKRELFGSLASKFGGKKEEQRSVRPPYFADENDFYKECLECDGKCVTFCKEHIIIISEDKTPILDFSKSGCTYCDECALACDRDVLKLEYKSKIKARFSIDILKCLSWNQVMCFSCKDPCLDNAIKFLGMFRPEIKEDLCTNCGFCVKVCPSDAISWK
ncbi:MAG: ferredoxin-type protein NapF [Arcobacteraceae bacterium]|nr:ferredoxin-type protein NapF [Arcobacteraceae bacterium]